MPTLLSATEIREHLETDLPDTALVRLIEDADQEIIDRLGALATETRVLDGGDALLHLDRRASSITSATERIYETDYALAANDYELLSDGFRIQRKQGTNYPGLTWRGRVTVVYVPYGGATGEQAARRRLLVDLVKLAEAYNARKSLSIGDASMSSVDYEKERTALFAPLMSRNRRMRLA